jgi:hypothetical protein
MIISKELVCKEFGELEASKYTLHRVDAFEEPIYPLRRELSLLTKMNVASGDLLVLKSDQELTNDEKITLSISMTMKGVAEDS